MMRVNGVCTADGGHEMDWNRRIGMVRLERVCVIPGCIYIIHSETKTKTKNSGNTIAKCNS